MVASLVEFVSSYNTDITSGNGDCVVGRLQCAYVTIISVTLGNKLIPKPSSNNPILFNLGDTGT